MTFLKPWLAQSANWTYSRRQTFRQNGYPWRPPEEGNDDGDKSKSETVATRWDDIGGCERHSGVHQRQPRPSRRQSAIHAYGRKWDEADTSSSSRRKEVQR